MIGAVEPAEFAERLEQSSRKGFLFRRTVGAFGLEIPVSTKGLMLAEEERTLSILRHIEQTVPVETKWWPVFRRYVDLFTGRVAGMGGDPTQVLPSGDGDWKGGHDHDHGHDHGHDHDCRDHDHGYDPKNEDDHKVTGKVVSIGYDHFGDFTGFVVETERDGHVLVHSSETRVERLAREAWRTRALVRVRLLPNHEVASLRLAGQVEVD